MPVVSCPTPGRIGLPVRLARERWVRLEWFHGLRIDWLKPLLPCYQRVLEEARQEIVLDCPVRIAASEGLILMKLLAFRRQDQVDIEPRLRKRSHGCLAGASTGTPTTPSPRSIAGDDQGLVGGKRSSQLHRVCRGRP